MQNFTNVTEFSNGSGAFRVSESDAGLVDRRRPGRMEFVSPELVQIMRGTASVQPDQLASDATLDDSWNEDDGVPLLGIAAAMVFSLPLWAALVAVGWAFLA